MATAIELPIETLRRTGRTGLVSGTVEHFGVLKGSQDGGRQARYRPSRILRVGCFWASGCSSNNTPGFIHAYGRSAGSLQMRRVVAVASGIKLANRDLNVVDHGWRSATVSGIGIGPLRFHAMRRNLTSTYVVMNNQRLTA